MNVGLTFDLKSCYLALGHPLEAVSECDEEATIELLSEAIEGFGHRVERIGNVKQLVNRLGRGERWDFVFNYAVGIGGSAREAQVPAVLEAYEIPYTFSDARLMGLVLDKALTKSIVAEAGVPTAPFWLVRQPADLEKIPANFPLFAKPVAEGSSKGISVHSRVNDAGQLRGLCLRLMEAFDQEVLVEEYLPGREMTVGIVGTGEGAEVLGVLEIEFLTGIENAIYCHQTKLDWADKVEYRVAADEVAQLAGQTALAAWRALGGRDCGRIDIRLDRDGVPQFVELNTIPGLSAVSDLVILGSKLGLSYRQLIGRILKSFEKRVGSSRQNPVVTQRALSVAG